jgi:hypothetical protein
MWPFKKKEWIEIERQFMMRDNSEYMSGTNYLFGTPSVSNTTNRQPIPPTPVTLITYQLKGRMDKFRQIVLDGHIDKSKELK